MTAPIFRQMLMVAASVSEWMLVIPFAHARGHEKVGIAG
jgi:hypothetical protein